MALTSHSMRIASPASLGHPDRGSPAAEALAAHAVRSYEVRSARIDCVEGELWVTGPGIGDELLGSGDSLYVTRPGKIVIEALSAARLRVRPSR